MKLSDAAFRSAWEARISSPEWKKGFRPRALAHYHFRCAVCGAGYLKAGWTKWQLQVDHRAYWKGGSLIFGRETFDDVRVLCPDHHGKGVRSDDSIKSWASSYRWLSALSWVVFLPLRVVWWLLRHVWKSLWYAPRRVD